MSPRGPWGQLCEEQRSWSVLAHPSARPGAVPVLRWTRGAQSQQEGACPGAPCMWPLDALQHWRPAHGARRAWGSDPTEAAGPDGLCLAGVPEVPVQA